MEDELWIALGIIILAIAIFIFILAVKDPLGFFKNLINFIFNLKFPNLGQKK